MELEFHVKFITLLDFHQIESQKIELQNMSILLDSFRILTFCYIFWANVAMPILASITLYLKKLLRHTYFLNTIIRRKIHAPTTRDIEHSRFFFFFGDRAFKLLPIVNYWVIYVLKIFNFDFKLISTVHEHQHMRTL